MTPVEFVLDAWAALAILRGEPAAGQVEDAVRRGSACSWINLGEVLYIESRRLDAATARAAVEMLADNVLAELPDVSLIRAAADLKAAGGLSYADCFAVATAARHGVPLLTGDPEIIAFERSPAPVVDLRSAGR